MYEVLCPAAPEVVEDSNAMTILKQRVDEVRTKEARTARDEGVFGPGHRTTSLESPTFSLLTPPSTRASAPMIL